MLPSNSTELVTSEIVSPVINLDGSITTSPEIADFNDGTITNGVCNGGSSHLNILDGSDQWPGAQTLQWGACSDTFAMTMAINEALQDVGTGISLDKIHYRWKWINGCFNVTKSNGDTIWCDVDIENRLDDNMKPTGEYADQFDTLNIVIELSDSDGNVIETRTYNYDTWYSWYEQNAHSTNETSDGEGAVWQITEDHIELFNHITGSGIIYTPNQLGNISFVANAQDNGQFEGYYGPVAREGEMWFTYRNNPCDLDTLYNPTCPGYANAYAKYLYDKACIADTLYDIGCPGYDAAYLEQQCTYNSLYSVQCPLYQTAYYNQQCELDSQYDIGCPGYIAPTIENTIPDPIAEIVDLTPSAPVVTTIMPEIIIPEVIIPEIVEIIPENIPVIEEITTETIEIEIASIEAEVQNESESESIITPADTSVESESGNTESAEVRSEPEDEGLQSRPSIESPEESTAEDESKSGSDEESTEESENNTATKDNDGKEKDTGEDTSSEDSDGKDKESIDDSEETDKTVESEKNTTGLKKKEEDKTKPTAEEKKNSRKEKIKNLIAAKVNALTKKVEKANTIEEQMIIQAQLAALIAFVPDFDYEEKKVPDIYFYPPEPTVDHAFSRWFVNDPTFGIMEDLQYPSLRQ